MATCPECRESINHGASKCPHCLSSISATFEEEQEAETRSKAFKSYLNKDSGFTENIGFEEYLDMYEKDEDEDDDSDDEYGYFSDLTDDEENY